MTNSTQGSPLLRNIRRRPHPVLPFYRGGNLRSRGIILLQTLVMVLILAMISIMTLKWVLGRYVITMKVSKSINCRALADACLAQKIALWGGTDPANGTHWCSIENPNDVRVNVSGPAGSKTINFVVDYDDCTYR